MLHPPVSPHMNSRTEWPTLVVAIWLMGYRWLAEHARRPALLYGVIVLALIGPLILVGDEWRSTVGTSEDGWGLYGMDGRARRRCALMAAVLLYEGLRRLRSGGLDQVTSVKLLTSQLKSAPRFLVHLLRHATPNTVGSSVTLYMLRRGAIMRRVEVKPGTAGFWHDPVSGKASPIRQLTATASDPRRL
jgi:hypothetical protein